MNPNPKPPLKNSYWEGEGPKLSLKLYWVAVKELKLSYYIGETLLFTIFTHYGNLI